MPSDFLAKEKYSNRRVLETDKFKKLDLGLKLAVSMVDYRNRFVAEQVAFCLDDIITAVEEGKGVLEKKRIENPILKDKRLEDTNEEAEKKLLEEKTKKTREYMKATDQQLKDDNGEKEKEKKEKDEEDKKKKDEEERKKKDANTKFWKDKATDGKTLLQDKK